MHKKTSQETIDLFIKEYLEGDSIVVISKKYNTSSQTVWKYILKAGINRPMSISATKHSLNKHYFDEIDTEYKAYFLGLLFGDGSNDYGVKNNRVTISMLEEDALEVLTVFKKELNLSRELILSKGRKADGNTGSNLLTLTIYNKHMCQVLKNLGMTKNKSKDMKFPLIPANLYRHFVRGYFDADGSVQNKSGYQASICSNSERLLLDIKEIVNIPSKIYVRQQKNLNYILHYGKIETTSIFHNWMYKDSNVFLSRKKNCIYNKY